jgi:hypothetical protein
MGDRRKCQTFAASPAEPGGRSRTTQPKGPNRSAAACAVMILCFAGIGFMAYRRKNAMALNAT